MRGGPHLFARLLDLFSLLHGSRVEGESWCLLYNSESEDSTRSYVGLIIFILYSKINTRALFNSVIIDNLVVTDSVKGDAIFTDLPIVLVKHNSILGHIITKQIHIIFLHKNLFL